MSIHLFPVMNLCALQQHVVFCTGSQDHHPSKNSVQKTIRCNSTSNAPDDWPMYPKHVELRVR